MHHPLTGPDGLPAPVLVIATGHHLSLALLGADDIAAHEHRAIQRGHAEALLPAIAALLEGQPRASSILVETGPGSFTGLRVGIAAARALGLAWGVPVRGVSSTLLVAAAAHARGHRGPLLVALAAPRGQVWLQAFDGFVATAPAVSLPPEAAFRLLACSGTPATGSGCLAAPETTPDAAAARHVPARLTGEPLPLYLSAPGPEAAPRAA